MILEHVGIVVKNRDESMDFYTKVLGFNILRKYEISPERDNHLTSEGHRLMGRWLYNYLKGKKIIEKKYKQK